MSARRILAAICCVVLSGLGAVGATPAALAVPPGPVDTPEYWFDTWQVPELWTSGARGQGVTIAEIDTGVNATLPELAGRVLPGKDFGRRGNGQVDREVSSFGHGTAMASIMVARPGLLDITGLAPGAKILPVAVPLNGTKDKQNENNLPNAIRWAASHGADIISMSVGGKQNPKYDGVPCPVEEQAAVYYALSRGAVVVASIGNTGPTGNAVEAPASCLGVVSVGAVDRSGRVAYFSAREPYLSLAAPGVNIPSLGRIEGDAFSGDGTSQATALVSASLALAWSKYPELSGRQLVTRLLWTLDKHRTVASDSSGYGLLDAYRLVTEAVPADAPNPVYAAAQPFRDRDAALDHFAGAAPAPAATKPISNAGRYAVGNTSRITRQVQAGLAIAAAGLLALLVLLVVGVRRRRAPGQPMPAADRPMPTADPAMPTADPAMPTADPAMPTPEPRMATAPIVELQRSRPSPNPRP